MSFPIPKIIYDPGTGPVTLTFTWPPVSKPGANKRTATRFDSDTLSGYRQSFTTHVAQYLTLQMDAVPQADLGNWATFIDFAIRGPAFDYYPDATSGSFKTYTLNDTDWDPSFAYRTMAKFKIEMRLVAANS